MPPTAAPPSPPRPGSVDRHARAVWAGLAFVLLCLATLVLVPVWVRRPVGPARAAVVNAEAARTLVTTVQFGLAREMSALRGFLIQPNDTLILIYDEALRNERRAHAELAPVAAGLGPEVHRLAVELRTLSEEWHARVDDDSVVARRGTAPGLIPGVPLEQALYERTLLAATGLDAALAASARERRARIERAEQLARSLTLVLVALAAAAALVLAWLAARVRHLAREAAVRGQEAEAALEEARRVHASRDRMLRGVTHDVKNPLGAADGYAELLEMGLEGELAPGQARMVAGIRRSIRAALAIIADLLEVTRAESGALPVSRREVDLAALLREVADEYRGAARAAGHRLEVELPAGPLSVHTDPGRVRQVVGNLLSNAIKYTPEPGRISVAAALDGEGGAARWAEVRVRDTGPGIPPEERENVFGEFHRLHGGEVEGHGLGLAISRRIARLLGGDVTAGGEPGAGAVFTLRLPLREEEGARPAAERR